MSKKRVQELVDQMDKAEIDHTVYLEEILEYCKNPQRVAFLITRLEAATAKYEAARIEHAAYVERMRKPWHKRLFGE